MFNLSLKTNLKFTKYLLSSISTLKISSIVGSVVECSPATRAARVRFPDDANPFFLIFIFSSFMMERNNLFLTLSLHCPYINMITSGQHKSDNNNRMIQLTDAFCALSIYKCASNIWLQLSGFWFYCPWSHVSWIERRNAPHNPAKQDIFSSF